MPETGRFEMTGAAAWRGSGLCADGGKTEEPSCGTKGSFEKIEIEVDPGLLMFAQSLDVSLQICALVLAMGPGDWHLCEKGAVVYELDWLLFSCPWKTEVFLLWILL